METCNEKSTVALPVLSNKTAFFVLLKLFEDLINVVEESPTKEKHEAKIIATINIVNVYLMVFPISLHVTAG